MKANSEPSIERTRSVRSSYLESRLRVVPVCPHDEGLFREEFGDVDGVLLRPLVLNVVTEAPGEPDLGRVMNIASHLNSDNFHYFFEALDRYLN